MDEPMICKTHLSPMEKCYGLLYPPYLCEPVKRGDLQLTTEMEIDREEGSGWVRLNRHEITEIVQGLEWNSHLIDKLAAI